jgi:hypothetical protein
MADGQVCWCELAFLLTTQRKLYDRRAGALSSSSQKSRIATGRTRAQKPACAYVQVGSYIANARGRSRSRAHGRGNDTGGSRRENVDDEECCFTSGERYVHPPDIDDHRPFVDDHAGLASQASQFVPTANRSLAIAPNVGPGVLTEAPWCGHAPRFVLSSNMATL